MTVIKMMQIVKDKNYEAFKQHFTHKPELLETLIDHRGNTEMHFIFFYDFFKFIHNYLLNLIFFIFNFLFVKSKLYKLESIKKYIRRARGLAVRTSPLQGEGPRFESGRAHYF